MNPEYGNPIVTDTGALPLCATLFNQGLGENTTKNAIYHEVKHAMFRYSCFRRSKHEYFVTGAGFTTEANNNLRLEI